LLYAFLDEAGISTREPVSIYAGILANEGQLEACRLRLRQVLEAVPPPLRDKPFHATDIWNKAAFREGWTSKQRFELLNAVMAVPREFDVPILLGMKRRHSTKRTLPDEVATMVDNVTAFSYAASRIGHFLATYAPAGEKATLVLEDNQELRRRIKKVFASLAADPFIVEGQLATRYERAAGITPSPQALQVAGIDTLRFSKKGDDTLLSLADACAFAFRRYFGDYSDGVAFIESVLGGEPVREDFAGTESAMLFRHGHFRFESDVHIVLPTGGIGVVRRDLRAQDRDDPAVPRSTLRQSIKNWLDDLLRIWSR
jgi:hypothetical protein